MPDRKKLLAKYQKAMRRFCGLPAAGVLPHGTACHVEGLPEGHGTHGDVVHPCVRYVEKGFEGHRWWMVYTPYYAQNSALENPILCHADAGPGQAPTRWTYYCTVKGRPEVGFNSDPALIIANDRLHVFWRESYTARTKALGCSRATVGCTIRNRETTEFRSPQLVEIPRNEDREVSPAFCPHGDAFRAYAVHVRFCSKLMYRIPQWLKWRINRLFDITGKLGLYSCVKSRGAAVWEGASLDGPFKYLETVGFKGVNRLYNPWHMDIFDADGPDGKRQLYAVVQTNQKNADICLACGGSDGGSFTFIEKPLVTDRTAGMTGLYKPTALVVDGMFHLFYTACNNDDPLLNRLFAISLPWKELLERLR